MPTSWTTPNTQVTGYLVKADPEYNSELIGNLLYLKDHVDALEAAMFDPFDFSSAVAGYAQSNSDSEVTILSISGKGNFLGGMAVMIGGAGYFLVTEYTLDGVAKNMASYYAAHDKYTRLLPPMLFKTSFAIKGNVNDSANTVQLNYTYLLYSPQTDHITEHDEPFNDSYVYHVTDYFDKEGKVIHEVKELRRKPD